MAVTIPIWPGSASFYPGDTPHGFYDNDRDFRADIEKVADWCAKRLGYPVLDVELNQYQFFAAFEEAITEYGHLVNSYAARENLLGLMGMETGSLNLTEMYVEPTLAGLFKIAKEYGTAAGIGGSLTHYTGSINITGSKQIYDLKSDSGVNIEAGDFATDTFTIRKLFYEAPPAIVRYFDPYLSTGLSSQTVLDQFDWGGMSPAISFVLTPIYYDLLRLQAIEFNDQIRKSAYTFKLVNDRLFIFPIPTTSFKMWFHYTLEGDVADNMVSGRITNLSNIPYYNPVYCRINDIGKQWIRKYTLGIVKEMLGWVRGKYQSLPAPGSEIQPNYTELLTSGQEIQENARIELKDLLDSMSKDKLLERKKTEAEMLSEQLKYVPLKIYRG